MGNTTTLAITCFICEDNAIKELEKLTGLSFVKNENNSSFDTYALWLKGGGVELIDEVREKFQLIDWDSPNMVSLHYETDGTEYDGVDTIKC